MRYPPEHKAATHQKIVKDASRRIRTEGLTGAAVSTVMQDTGLTHGGFYKHFESKDELLLESLNEAFREITDRLLKAAKESRPEVAWKAIVTTYLQPEHCSQAENWCPLTALAPEMVRTSKEMKSRIFDELRNYKDLMQPFMPGRRTVDKERAFFVIFSTMIGAIQIARLLPDPALREKILANTRDFLLGTF
ncbi:TetR/AcrR family transcriptional regulator [Terriglobus albidus]|uniref:TetR/AcrR family transcriptional regulator n=1 Tax=Terriglobus albidus TaxID=1592106 RepID=A0A5B9EBG7_9BACT|nr:TetR/AcrR family transcriptional regulator [Terriglobus albidus]QEE29044.1 TetR/AcrR family transcriptional regulator [Terriglobus albidus]